MAVPLPHRQDRLRSAPGTSYIDPRGVSGHDLDSAFQQARLGLNPDYFSDSPRYDGIRPHSPFHPGVGRLESEFGSSFRGSEASLEDHVRRTNLAVALANSQVSSRARYALLHPMTTSDGRFPEDFNVPKTVESVSQFDNTQLDRILSAYRLPPDSRTLLDHRRDIPSGGRHLKLEKLQVLLEYLGATRIIDRVGSVKQAWM